MNVIVLLPWAERRGPAGRRWGAAVASWCRGGENTQDAFLPAEISHVQTSLLKREKKTLFIFAPHAAQTDCRYIRRIQSQKREKLFLVNGEGEEGGRSGGGARHSGKFSGEACHSSHHHFSPSTNTSSSVPLTPALCHCFHKPDPSTHSKKKKQKEAARSCRNEKGVIPHSCHNLDGGWRNASAEVPSLTARKDELPKSKCFFWKLPCSACVTGTEWWAEV